MEIYKYKYIQSFVQVKYLINLINMNKMTAKKKKQNKTKQNKRTFIIEIITNKTKNISNSKTILITRQNKQT